VTSLFLMTSAIKNKKIQKDTNVTKGNFN